MLTGTQKASVEARKWATDATPIMAYALGVLPSGWAETWCVSFWSGAKSGYLVVEQSKSSSKEDRV